MFTVAILNVKLAFCKMGVLTRKCGFRDKRKFYRFREETEKSFKSAGLSQKLS